MSDKIDVIVEAIKLFDKTYDGDVILTQNNNAMEEVVVCLRDKATYDQVVEKLDDILKAKKDST